MILPLCNHCRGCAGPYEHGHRSPCKQWLQRMGGRPLSPACSLELSTPTGTEEEDRDRFNPLHSSKLETQTQHLFLFCFVLLLSRKTLCRDYMHSIWQPMSCWSVVKYLSLCVRKMTGVAGGCMMLLQCKDLYNKCTLMGTVLWLYNKPGYCRPVEPTACTKEPPQLPDSAICPWVYPPEQQKHESYFRTQ